MNRPCIECGTPTPGTRCPDCAADRQRGVDAHRGGPTARGYDTTWRHLSARAVRLQPWCHDCHGPATPTDPLTADHLPGTWAKRDRRETLTIADVEVVHRTCNSRRGARRHLPSTTTPPGGTPPATLPDTRDPCTRAITHPAVIL